MGQAQGAGAFSRSLNVTNQLDCPFARRTTEFGNHHPPGAAERINMADSCWRMRGGCSPNAEPGVSESPFRASGRRALQGAPKRLESRKMPVCFDNSQTSDVETWFCREGGMLGHQSQARQLRDIPITRLVAIGAFGNSGCGISGFLSCLSSTTDPLGSDLTTSCTSQSPAIAHVRTGSPQLRCCCCGLSLDKNMVFGVPAHQQAACCFVPCPAAAPRYHLRRLVLVHVCPSAGAAKAPMM